MPDIYSTVVWSCVSAASAVVSSCLISGYSPRQIAGIAIAASFGSMLAMVKTRDDKLSKKDAVMLCIIGVVLSVFISHVLGYITASRVNVDGLGVSDYTTLWAIIVSICMGQIFDGVRNIVTTVMNGVVDLIKSFVNRASGGK
jgi:uncharacterized membrane protein